MLGKEVEIEFKNILNQVEYHRLFDHFEFSKQIANQQTNIYFDTPDKTLESMDTALRLRRTGTYNHLTLKQPLTDHKKLETTEKLSDIVSKRIATDNTVPETDEIGQILYNLEIHTKDLQNIGSFETKRYETAWRGHSIVLDHVKFDHFEDYELELETKNLDKGLADFEKFLIEFSIEKRPSEQKIRRMKRTEPIYLFE